MPIRA